MTRVSGFLLCVSLLAAGSAAGAPPPQRERAITRLKHDLEKVGLSAEQKQKIQALFDAGKKEQDELDDRMHAAFKELRGLLDKDSPDEQAVLHQADKIGELRTAQHKGRLRTMLQVQAQLTPEQRTKLKEARHGGGAGGAKTPQANTPEGKTPVAKTPAAG
jgi:Spy/CpxP family protein refolding chaperone